MDTEHSHRNKKVEKGMAGNVAEGLSYDNTLPLRGILAVEIVLGHFYGRVSDCSLIQFNNRAGVLVVGISFVFNLVMGRRKRFGFL